MIIDPKILSIQHFSWKGCTVLPNIVHEILNSDFEFGNLGVLGVPPSIGSLDAGFGWTY